MLWLSVVTETHLMAGETNDPRASKGVHMGDGRTHEVAVRDVTL